MRAALPFVLLLAAIATPAAAGDAAELNILGFSRDGRVFAFEEFGIQDGSGFPYAHRFYIDTATDKFLSGTPVRVRIEDENTGLSVARAEAKRKGEKIIADATLNANRGHSVGANALGEINADKARIVVNPRSVFPPIDEPIEFRVEKIPVDIPERCQDFLEIGGLRALRVRAQDGEATQVLHVDSKIPLSRGCPTGYGVAAVQTMFPDSGEPVFALVIAVERIGFEGPDFRYIALTGHIDD
ncbi:MAG: DUF2259 domain-containing protein [Phyllobacteriaceae bacterium]|nr:DUF2259 domain-containing protein [Phyllobacteriaceae bacterium]